MRCECLMSRNLFMKAIVSADFYGKSKDYYAYKFTSSIFSDSNKSLKEDL